MDVYKTTVKYKNLRIDYEVKSFRLKDVFKISRSSKSNINTIKVSITNKKNRGIGECVPYKRYGDSLSQILKILKSNKNYKDIHQIKSLPLQNAISNAFYDLKLREKKIKFLKIIKKIKFISAVTIPIFSKVKFTKEVKKYKNIKYLKIKVNQKNVFGYLNIIKKYSPKSKIIIDANEGWTIKFFHKHENSFKKYNILFIEQPVKSNQDHLLNTKIPLCADESFHKKSKLKNIKKYKWVNIKADKFGNEQEILKAIKFAKKNKLKIFFGCMVSSSLSIIPMLRFAKFCNLLDLDGPLFLLKDYKNGLQYKGNVLIYNKRFDYGYL